MRVTAYLCSSGCAAAARPAGPCHYVEAPGGRKIRAPRAARGGPSVRVAAWYNLGGGGAKRALFQHVRGLVAAGHEVEVWCPSTARTDFLPLADLVIEHVDPIAAEALRGPVRVRDVAWQGLRPGAGLAEVDRHLPRGAAQISA